MLSQCSDFMKTWLSAEDESSIDSFSSKTVHFLIPHVLCQLRRLVYVFFIPFFKCFLISLMKIPFYTVAMKRRRWGWEIAQSEDNTECREIFLFWKGLNQGLKGGRKWRTGEREITVSVRFLGIKLHVISGKKLSFETWKALSVLQSERRSGWFLDTIWLSYFWWKAEGIPIWWLLFSYSRRRQASLCRKCRLQGTTWTFEDQKWFAVVAMNNIKSKSSKEMQWLTLLYIDISPICVCTSVALFFPIATPFHRC